MRFWTKVKTTATLIRNLGIYALSPSVVAAWSERERLHAEVRDLEAKVQQAERKRNHANATYHREIRKTFPA